jgi:ABC-type lipoprotein release transport system permease subunit
MLAENFWREEFHAEPSVLGKSLDLDGKSCTVVGVMPDFMPSVSRVTQTWLPLETNRIASVLGSQGASPLAIVLGALLLSLVAVVAAAAPVCRATQVQPVEELRNE